MGLLQTAKRAVPLEWKVAFHKHKTLPRYLAVRFANRVKGDLPLPPANLILLVSGGKNPKWFLDKGREASQAIREILEQQGLNIEQFASILDFGCGCGRIMRHWKSTVGPAWHGTDYNPKLIEWCRDNLKFSDFKVNTLSGKLPYENESFDFIYAYSVFTHLKEELQFFWINELSRVLKPGGYLYFTTHGDYFINKMTPAERELYHKGQPVVREEEASGSNFCAVFHPSRYVHETIVKNFAVLDFIPGSAHGKSDQDIHLVRKPI